MMSRYYDRQGNPLLRMSDADWSPEGRRVAKTTIGDVDVSTVHLIIDHRFGDGPPLIFETMVFGGPLDEECDRYSTEAEAKAGHAAMVARVCEAGESR